MKTESERHGLGLKLQRTIARCINPTKLFSKPFVAGAWVQHVLFQENLPMQQYPIPHMTCVRITWAKTYCTKLLLPAPARADIIACISERHICAENTVGSHLDAPSSSLFQCLQSLPSTRPRHLAGACASSNLPLFPFLAFKQRGHQPGQAALWQMRLDWRKQLSPLPSKTF